jgi:arylsulfatase A-like enzyme
MQRLFIGGLALLSSCVLRQEEKTRPNFLLIYTDDQRYDAVGVSGNDLVETPSIDELASRGMFFQQAFVTTSISSPSRAAVLTGRYGIANGVSVVSSSKKLDADETTIARMLDTAGYVTGVVGKWHLGNAPASIGFDYYSVFHGNGSYYHRTIHEQGTRFEINEYIDRFTVDRGIYFIDSVAKDNPFFLFLCTQIPHMNDKFDWEVTTETVKKYRSRSFSVPESWHDDLHNKPEYLKTGRNHRRAVDVYDYDIPDSVVNHIQKYYAAVTEMDAELGRVLEKIYNSDLQDNTYIFFMSDNGWFNGEHKFTSKVLAYEESIHVPLIISGPGLCKGRSEELVLNIDIMPTILDLAGIARPGNLHGNNLVPLLQNNKYTSRKHIYYEAPVSQLGSMPLYALRLKEGIYIETCSTGNPDSIVFREYYNLNSDPFQLENVIDSVDTKALNRLLSDKRKRYKE